MNKKPTVYFQDLGLKDYQEAWDYQHTLLKKVIEHKRHNRNLTKANTNETETAKKQTLEELNYLLFCEHPPVYTLGKSGSLDHLLLNEQQLDNQGIDFYKINRGGDITFHGPGQVVGYPIFDLDLFFTDVHKYVRYLEEVIIRTLKEYKIEATRIEGFTGVWIEGKKERPNRKICAIGVHLSRWVTMHGFALNANTKLQYFNNIIPCGINDKDKEVTSLSQELGMLIDMDVLKNKLKYHFRDLFGFEYHFKN